MHKIKRKEKQNWLIIAANIYICRYIFDQRKNMSTMKILQHDVRNWNWTCRSIHTDTHTHTKDMLFPRVTRIIILKISTVAKINYVFKANLIKYTIFYETTRKILKFILKHIHSQKCCYPDQNEQKQEILFYLTGK